METFSTLLAFFAGNSAVIGELPAQRPVARSFDAFFDLHGWVNNGEAGDLRRHCAHYDVIVMTWNFFVLKLIETFKLQWHVCSRTFFNIIMM